ncbi:hypothetical protein D3C84_747270 [compost metagenome]
MTEAQKTTAEEDWKIPLAQAGIDVAAIDQGWTLRVAPAGQGSQDTPDETPDADDE